MNIFNEALFHNLLIKFTLDPVPLEILGIAVCHFCNLKDRQTPEYLLSQIPVERRMNYNLRRVRTYTPSFGRTRPFSDTYFDNVVCEWNILDSDTGCSHFISEFKRKLLC